MREIKFRAWDKFKKVFIPSDIYAIVQTDFNAFGIMLKDWMDYREGEYFYENSQELSQYTGLKDKNGKEIYAGDLCKDFNGEIHEVIHHNGYFSFGGGVMGCGELEQSQMLIEIIGNIYENR